MLSSKFVTHPVTLQVTSYKYLSLPLLAQPDAQPFLDLPTLIFKATYKQ